MKRLRAVPLLSAFALSGLCLGIALLSGKAPASADFTGAPAVVADFATAFNKHDLNKAMSFVDDQFVEVFPDGNIVGGKDDEHARLATIFAGSPHVTMVLDHLIGDQSTAAAQVGMYNEPPKGEPPAAQYAYFFSVIDGKIRAIAVYTRNEQAQKEAGAK